MTVPLRLSCLAALPSANDQTLRRLLLVARLHAFFVPPRVDHVAATACAATVRVIDWVHDFAAYARTTSLPASLPRFAPRHQFVLFVADDADRRETAPVNQTHFRGRHAHRHVVA